MGQEKETGKSLISYTSMHYDVISFSQLVTSLYSKKRHEDFANLCHCGHKCYLDFGLQYLKTSVFVFLGTLKTFFLSLNFNDLYIILKLISSILSCTIALQSIF